MTATPAPPASTERRLERRGCRRRRCAALIHTAVMPAHFAQSVWNGSFFLAAAVGQLCFAALVIIRPCRHVVLAGIACSVSVVVLWLLTRTVGCRSDRITARRSRSACSTCSPPPSAPLRCVRGAAGLRGAGHGGGSRCAVLRRRDRRSRGSEPSRFTLMRARARPVPANLRGRGAAPRRPVGRCRPRWPGRSPLGDGRSLELRALAAAIDHHRADEDDHGHAVLVEARRLDRHDPRFGVRA